MTHKKPANKRLERILKDKGNNWLMYIGAFCFGLGLIIGWRFSFLGLLLLIIYFVTFLCRWNAGIVLEIRELKKEIKKWH